MSGWTKTVKRITAVKEKTGVDSKIAKTDFTQELLQQGERVFSSQYRTGLNFKYSMNKWEYIAKKQGAGGGQWKITKRKHQG